ncbi:hypothetical protein FB45DRAFT_900850, partial [Roridomyces roridus]
SLTRLGTSINVNISIMSSRGKSNVCNTWTRIAQSTPALWTTIHLEMPRADGFEQLLEQWFQYAGKGLLNVYTTGTLDDGVARAICHHSSHLARLDEDYDDPITMLDLASTQLTLLPVLRTLAIHGDDDVEFRLRPILQLLRRSPNLVALEVEDILLEEEDEADDTHVLSNLRRLSLNSSAYTILGCISAPRLEFINLDGLLANNSEDVIPFLQQSSLSLHTLRIGNPIQIPAVHDILPLLPSVTHVEFGYMGGRHIVQELFTTVLAPAAILPNLQSLHFTHLINDPPWDAILQVLSARRARIRSVRLAIGYESAESGISIPADALTVLKELAAGGVDIWVGTKTGTLFHVSRE